MTRFHRLYETLTGRAMQNARTEDAAGGVFSSLTSPVASAGLTGIAMWCAQVDLDAAINREIDAQFHEVGQ